MKTEFKNHIKQIIRLYPKTTSPWEGLEYKQAFKDVLESMKRCNLITDFMFNPLEIILNDGSVIKKD